MFSKDEVSVLGKTWNACIFMIESPRGRSAKRQRRAAPRFLSRSAPQGLKSMYLHIVLSNGMVGFFKWLI